MRTEFSNWLEYRLAVNNLLAVDLAKKMRMSESTISCYRHGKNVPRFATVVALCHVLGDDPEKVWKLIKR